MDNKYHFTCQYCETEFTYTDKDVKRKEGKDGDVVEYAVCPTCGHFMAINITHKHGK